MPLCNPQLKKSSAVAQALWTLAPKTSFVATTNYDRYLEDVLNRSSVTHPSDDNAAASSVYHLHGYAYVEGDAAPLLLDPVVYDATAAKFQQVRCRWPAMVAFSCDVHKDCRMLPSMCSYLVADGALH